MNISIKLFENIYFTIVTIVPKSFKAMILWNSKLQRRKHKRIGKENWKETQKWQRGCDDCDKSLLNQNGWLGFYLLCAHFGVREMKVRTRMASRDMAIHRAEEAQLYTMWHFPLFSATFEIHNNRQNKSNMDYFCLFYTF